MALSDFRTARLLARRSGRYPDGPDLSCRPQTILRHAVAITPVDRTGASVDPSPSVGAFPELGAGRRPRLLFSRPAQHLHVTACQIARPPMAAFVTRHRPGSCPPTVARQLPSPIDFGSCGLLLPLGSMIVSGHTPTYRPAPATEAQISTVTKLSRGRSYS